MKRRSETESEEEEEDERARRMASQQGLPEGMAEWGLAEEGGGRGRKWEEPEEAAVQVASEPELVERWISVAVVVVAELKLMLWRSSAKSSSHGSMANVAGSLKSQTTQQTFVRDLRS